MSNFTRRTFLVGAGSTVATFFVPTSAAQAKGLGRAARRIAGVMTQNRVPAVSIVAVHRDQRLLTAAIGKRSADRSQKVDKDTLFQAASLSKTINALAVLTLQRDGLISLDASANSYLRRWRLTGPEADQVTVRRLLSHTAGTNVHGFGGYRKGGAVPGLTQILNGQRPANSPEVKIVLQPGTRFQYSGGGTTILQALTEDVTGKRYNDLVHERVFDPIGMRRSTMRRSPRRRNVALGHGQNGRQIPGGYHLYPEKAAAGLWTTPSEMGLAIQAVIAGLNGKRGSVLPQNLARQMVTPVADKSGLGTFVFQGNLMGHNGANAGYRSFYLANWSTGKMLVVMCNSDNGDAVLNVVANELRPQIGL